MSEEENELKYPDPSERIRPGAIGVEVRLADGRDWLLAHAGLGTGVDPIRDRMFDNANQTGSYAIDDLQLVTAHLLWRNYDVRPEEAVALIHFVDPAKLVPAVEEALFGSNEPSWTYSQWAAVSLAANGIDPTKCPPVLMPKVLSLLMQSRKAPPPQAVIQSARKAALRARLRSMVTPRQNGDGHVHQ